MDWGRAKTVLILSFLFLNLLLVYQMWITRWDPTISSGAASDMKKEANTKLASKNIRVLYEIPTEAPKLEQISVNYLNNSGNAPLVTLAKPLTPENLLTNNGFRDFAEQAGVKEASSYTFDSSRSNADMFVFNQMYEHLPMFDVTLQLFSKKTEITGYKQAIVEVQSSSKKKQQKVISAYTALRSISDYLPEGSVISTVSLGYHGQSFDSATHLMLPYWRIMLDNGEHYYVQAFTGAVEGNQDTPKT